MLRVGMVGTGFISEWHYNAFLENPDAKITGICANARKERAEALAKDWGIKAYADFDEMVTSSDIDAVVIGSRNPDHFSQIMKAMENGKHVLAEKPVVTDIAEIDVIAEAAKKNNVVLFPGHNFVYREAVQIAKKMLDNGDIGKLMYASFSSAHTISAEHSVGWRANMALSNGGALMDSGHHQTYMSLYFLGAPSKVVALKSNLLYTEREVEDTVAVTLLYPNNLIANITQTYTTDFSDSINGVKLIGDKGSLIVTDALYFNDEKLNTDADYADSFRGQAKAFSDCILHGKAPLSDLADVRNTLRIIYGAYESCESGKVYEL